jgi:glycosyltransferase involved in cell wall biosynthesis
MIKVVVVMTYFDRPYQLSRTLHTLAQTKYQNVEVVIVDDSSNQPPEVGITDIRMRVIRTRRKNWTNPEPAYNTGIQEALDRGADVVVLQNAECYHVNDVVSAAAEVTDANYLSFACFSLNEKTTFRPHDITALMMTNPMGATADGQNAWYNHPLYRPVAYDFCSAITVKNLVELNGYDERFSYGWGYGDDYLLQRIRWMGLKVDIPTNPMVVHQWHYNYAGAANRKPLIERNRLLYAKLVQERQQRAKHCFTQDFI